MSINSAKLEALLFLAGDAVSHSDIARLLNLPATEIPPIIADLQAKLTDRGLALVTTETQVQLTTSPAVGEYVKEFLQGETGSISTAAAETLALIAYRGPISRPDIEAIRGVDSRRMIRQLRIRGLIKRHTAVGQLPTYTITPEFLQHLGLTTASDLPNFAELSGLE